VDTRLFDGVPVKAVVSGKFAALARKVKNTRPTVTISSRSMVLFICLIQYSV